MLISIFLLDPQHKTVKSKNLISVLFDRILSQGVKQLITTATHSWPGQEDSGLDHFYTNVPAKISSVQVQFAGHSDHKIIHAVRVARMLKNSARYVRKRSFKEFNEKDFTAEVKNVHWWPVYSCEDPDEAAQIFTDKLTEILD